MIDAKALAVAFFCWRGVWPPDSTRKETSQEAANGQVAYQRGH